MKKLLILLIISFPILVAAQKDSVLSGVYDWKQPEIKSGKNLISSVLFEGTTHDMEWMQVTSNSLSSSKKETKIIVPENEEQIVIVKKGLLNATLNNEISQLIPGSVIVLLPKEKFSYQNKENNPCEFYILRYKSKLPAGIERGKKAGGSFIKDFIKIEFNPHDKGGIRNYFERPTVMGKRLEMHVSTLKAGLKSHDPHTHRAEEIVLMIDGNTEMQIGENFYKGKEGSLFYLGSNILHAIRNTGSESCTYFAFQFE